MKRIPNYSRATKNRFFQYIIKTYGCEKIVNKRTVYFDTPYMEAHDERVPIVIHSNQTLEYQNRFTWI